MWVLIAWLLVVAFARLWIWRDETSHALTYALVALAAGYTFVEPHVDDLVDPALSAVADNMGDALAVLCFAVGCYLIGRIGLRGNYTLRARAWRTGWAVSMGLATVVMVVASDFGNRELGGARLYQGIQALTVVATAFLILRRTLYEHQRQLWPITLAALGALASGTTYIVTLAIAPDWVAAHQDQMASTFAIPVISGLSIAGIFGVVHHCRGHGSKI